MEPSTPPSRYDRATSPRYARREESNLQPHIPSVLMNLVFR